MAVNACEAQMSLTLIAIRGDMCERYGGRNE